MSLKPKVALSSDFLAQLAKLPSSVHSKVIKWANQFQTDPQSPGINYEKINAVRDQRLRSVRIDQAYRGIVFKPDVGDVYVLMYVDRHDDAYKWAENRKVTINPITGAMQLVLLEEVKETLPLPGTAAKAGQIFSDLDDKSLLSLGVPEELLPLVRRINSDAELDEIQSRLPVEAYEGLFLVAAGDTVSQVLHNREARVDLPVDTSDFSTALDTPESRARFVVISDDESLMAILNAPLAQWRVFLHPTQRRLATGDRSGSVRVLGGAGTGKTVLAMHRAKWLAENHTNSKQKVLFSTFTKNLAADIEQNLKTLCSTDTIAKIEVRNLDAWVHTYMRTQKLEQRIVYDRKQEGASQAWQAALAVKDSSLDLTDEFYEQELAHVVLAQGITTLDAYRTARRTGRGILLSRAKRDAVWPVFEEYRGQLASRKLKDVDDAYREVAAMIEAQRRKSGGDEIYSAIVVDETQDFGPQALKLLRAMIAIGQNDLFFVGDGHQRIYSRNRSSMSKCGIDIRGRSKKLFINYRTTDEIRRQAVALLEGIEVDDLDEGHDEIKRYRSLSHGPAPAVLTVAGLEGAYAEVQKFLEQWKSTDEDNGFTFCIVAPSEVSRNAIGAQLQRDGLSTFTISAQTSHTDAPRTVYLSTMHRAKGLEFDCVAVVAPKNYMDGIQEERNDRQLLYVALTRAKRGAALILY